MKDALPEPTRSLDVDAANDSDGAPRRVQTAAFWRHRQRVQAATAMAAPAVWLHEEAARRMDSRLDMILTQPASVVDWWSDQGLAAELLRRRYPKAAHHALLPPRGRVPATPLTPAPAWWRRLVPGTAARDPLFDDAPHWHGASADLGAVASAPLAVPSPAQLLCANMMLHWADHPAAVLTQWFDRLAEGGLLMFSCLGPDTAQELRALHADAQWGPSGSELMDMHDIGDAVVRAGFSDPVMDMERLTLTWSSAGAALDEIRTWGGNAHPHRHRGLRTPRWRESLEQAWTRNAARPQGGVSVTVELIFGHAVRGPTRITMAPETQISLGEMRQMVRRRGI